MDAGLEGETQRILKVGSLFTGIGGFDLGFEREGFEIAWQSEIDEYCQAVLKAHWPDVPLIKDVHEITAESVPWVDVLCGGFPCQDISNAGTREGIVEGKRSGLWREFSRLISDIRPRYAVVENVSALTIRGMDTLQGDLAEIGYDSDWMPIRASDVGAPQQRERLFIVAYPQCDGFCAFMGREDGWVLCSCNRTETSGREGSESLGGGRCESCGDTRHRSWCGGGELSDAFEQGLERPFRTVLAGKGKRRPDANALRPTSGWPARRGRPLSATESGLGRTTNGFSNRMERDRVERRLKALGNSIVPQVAQYVAQQVKEHYRIHRWEWEAWDSKKQSEAA